MKNLIFCFVALLSINISFAQEGNVELIKDPRIDGLIKKQSEIIPPATGPQIKGFRVQIFFDSDKKLVDDARVRFITMFPKIDTYVTYSAPNYFLRVGDFRTQIEAERLKTEVGQTFPTSFIIKGDINLPRID